MEGFSEALAYELASQNIMVKIIEPHGGVTSTSFKERMAKDTTTAAALTDYDDFANRTNAISDSLSRARNIDSEDVAQVIYGASTDGTDQLRYLVGEDSRGIIKARRELTDQGYVDFMRSQFMAKV